MELPKIRRRYLNTHQFFIVMILLIIIWGMYLLYETNSYNSKLSNSEYLKDEIIKLSKEYINVLAKEKGHVSVGSSNTQQTAILLQNMLDRIETLEGDLKRVIINSTLTFRSMFETLSKLNKSIFEFNKTTLFQHYECFVPVDPNFPNCDAKVQWLSLNWNTSKYIEAGVNGSLCSFLQYLSYVEHECPKGFRQVIENKKTNTKNLKCEVKPHKDFPDCDAKIKWMQNSWKTDPLYAHHGVDGSYCSIIIYLSEVEGWCPMLDGRELETSTCPIPDDPEYPDCKKKIEWMKKYWTSDICYSQLGVNGSQCSFLAYISEYEHFCPLMPGRSHAKLYTDLGFSTIKPNLTQLNFNGLKKILENTEEPLKISWVVARISRMWKSWVNAFNNLKSRMKIDSYSKKKIFIYIGLLADEKIYHFADTAKKGGPLGELVQWSDLIASLYLLGHELVISVSTEKKFKMALGNVLKSSSVTGSCPSFEKPEFDIVYTDYLGMTHIVKEYKNFNSIRCHLRIVDSFGTEADFNVKVGNKVNEYGNLALNLKQYYTMFPHSPDNSFLGFIVESHVSPDEDLIKNKRIALVYGKDVKMWNDPRKIKFLDLVQKYFEVHATFGNPDLKKTEPETYIPSYVVNHGVLESEKLHNLLKQTTVFIGLGFPYEGPAPLEAIADGCFFINPKFLPPIGKENHDFFKTKPTNRRLTSQHPYAEHFIGEPYVFTFDINNPVEAIKVLEDINEKESQPYLPFEFSYEGMLERLFVFTKYHDFCKPNQTWPPLSARQVLIGDPGESCVDVCKKKDLLCEPGFFESINVDSSFFKCPKPVKKASLIAPAILNDQCLIQSDRLLFSCISSTDSAKRICPCRNFVKGQTAFPINSLLDDII
ncbi:alpha-1,6-mannosylglycoprotein 6-beta-N-acetylglucosaminyltransferase A isoform X1 [Hydra vulgaris]|uniref:alpha-1,6-mannosylglycoprotein 6-beta-N-acetylglucosaminyltransferase A isoform X1 n=1 Tax=Hydra vulgaris TaxID=6087 RepID=UPI001F5E51E8|nr:alpha-1,6-mannosylglycoprotein 6-beta-N-acetylglucosaminyltransferase A [Hydra vulgaris]